MPNYKIIFFGTPKFAVPALDALIANGLSPIAVITEPDRPAGRGQEIKSSVIKLLAQKNNIPVLQPDKISTCLPDRQALKSQPAYRTGRLSTLKPDVAVVVAYGQIIPKEILEIPRLGFINIHPSLLPKYRGPSPIQAAILNGDVETGVTIIKLDEKMDHGPILAQQELEVSNSKKQITNKIQIPIDYTNLSKELAKLGAELLLKTLTQYLEGRIVLKPQDHTNATYTKLINKSDGQINWDEPIDIIERKIRAYYPWPGVYTLINNKRLKICQVHVKHGKFIIDKVQLEGKKVMVWQEFIKGNKKIQEFIDKKLKK